MSDFNLPRLAGIVPLSPLPFSNLRRSAAIRRTQRKKRDEKVPYMSSMAVRFPRESGSVPFKPASWNILSTNNLCYEVKIIIRIENWIVHLDDGAGTGVAPYL